MLPFITSPQEDKKILYYYPHDDSLNRKVRNIGLCEALVNFTRTFHPRRPCEAVHTEKMRQVFLEPEENHWMVMVEFSGILDLCIYIIN